MKFKTVQKNIERTPQDLARIRAIREKFQKEKPTLEQLLASGEYDGPYSLRGIFITRALLRDLKQAREAAGLSLADVARRTGIDQAALSRLENGKNVNPTVDTLHRMAAALGMEITCGLAPADPRDGTGTVREPELAKVKIAINDFLDFVKTKEGQTLSTIHQKQPFTVKVIGENLEIRPSRTNKRRRHIRPTIERILKEFAETGSYSPSHYKKKDMGQNPTYSLALIRLYLVENGCTVEPL